MAMNNMKQRDTYHKGGNYSNRQVEVEKPVFQISSLSQTNYVECAEKVIRSLNDSNKLLTSSQIRNLLTLINEVYEMIRIGRPKKLSEELSGRIQYIKMRFVYAAGRSKDSKDYKVDSFMKQSGIIELLGSIDDSVDRFMLICKYMEALVAYHKYYGTR